MANYIPVHRNLERFFHAVNIEFLNHNDLENTSVQWLHSLNILYEGSLHKKAPNGIYKWQRRYVILFGHYVFYFKDAKSKVPQNWFSLRPYDTVDSVNETFAIRIKNSKNDHIRVYTFRASTYEDMQAWSTILKVTIDYIRIPGYIMDSYQREILKIKGMIPDVEQSSNPTADYSVILDTQVTDPDLSRLARQLGRGWKSFAREKLRIQQFDLERIKEDSKGVEEEIYAVLLHWRKRNKDSATKRTLIDLLKGFDEIDYCSWKFLEGDGEMHDHYVNQIADYGQSSQSFNLYSERVYSEQSSSTNDANETTEYASVGKDIMQAHEPPPSQPRCPPLPAEAQSDQLRQRRLANEAFADKLNSQLAWRL